MFTRTDNGSRFWASARYTCVALGLVAIASPSSSQEAGSATPGDGTLDRVLGGRFALERRGVPGEVRRLLVRRENRAVDRRGTTIGWTVAEGVVERTLLEKVEAGAWLERVAWKRFAFAEVQGSSAKPAAADEPAAAGTSFTTVTGRYDPGSWPKVADGSLEGRAGSTLAILGLDAVTWDAFAGLLSGSFGGSVSIGSSARQSGHDEAVAEVARGTRYSIGEAEVRVRGVTVIGDEAALLVNFLVSGSRLTVEREFGAGRLHIRGTEYFNGWGAFSLADGRVLEGELYGPLISTTELGATGGELTELPVGGAVQRVWIRELAADDR